MRDLPDMKIIIHHHNMAGIKQTGIPIHQIGAEITHHLGILIHKTEVT